MTVFVNLRLLQTINVHYFLQNRRRVFFHVDAEGNAEVNARFLVKSTSELRGVYRFCPSTYNARSTFNLILNAIDITIIKISKRQIMTQY